MENHKEISQQYDQDGSLRSHTEVKTEITPSYGHAEIVNVAISVVLAITAVFCCSMILVGAMTVIFSQMPKTEVTK